MRQPVLSTEKLGRSLTSKGHTSRSCATIRRANHSSYLSPLSLPDPFFHYTANHAHSWQDGLNANRTACPRGTSSQLPARKWSSRS